MTAGLGQGVEEGNKEKESIGRIGSIGCIGG